MDIVALYNTQINARALIGQSAVGYCAGKPPEKSRVFWIIRELKQERFWDANGNWKWTDFTFNSPSHNYIHITKLIFSIRDE